MFRGCLLLVASACSSPPNLCDRNTVAGITKVADHLWYGVSSHEYPPVFVHVDAPFTCDGGGSGAMNAGGSVMWSGTFTFDACTTGGLGSGDTLTLTGAVVIDADILNETFNGRTDSITVHGTVDGCAAPVDDEACAGTWDPDGKAYGNYTDTEGTLCGRAFP